MYMFYFPYVKLTTKSKTYYVLKRINVFQSEPKWWSNWLTGNMPTVGCVSQSCHFNKVKSESDARCFPILTQLKRQKCMFHLSI